MANTDVFADFVQFYRERQASEMSLSLISNSAVTIQKPTQAQQNAS